MHEVSPIDADKAWSTYFSNSFRSVFFTIVLATSTHMNVCAFRGLWASGILQSYLRLRKVYIGLPHTFVEYYVHVWLMRFLLILVSSARRNKIEEKAWIFTLRPSVFLAVHVYNAELLHWLQPILSYLYHIRCHIIRRYWLSLTWGIV